MNHTRKTTEFSTHLSRSRMRRYLHEQLSEQEANQVELHLAHCTQCSASLVNYIETEEPDQYNTYAKRLKGRLKEQKIAKRPFLSSFQIRALRATAAVLALFIFSFFGVKTIIDKEIADYQSDGKAVEVKKKPVSLNQKKPLKSRDTEKPTEAKSDKRLAENRPAEVQEISQATTTTKKEKPKKKEVPVKETSTRTASSTPAKAAVKQETPTAAPVTEQKETSISKTVSTPKPESQEEAEVIEKPEPIKKVANLETTTEREGTEESVSEDAPVPVNTLPTIKKMDTNKNVDASKPVSSTTPSVIPIPTNKLR